jgi:hypothetical protein
MKFILFCIALLFATSHANAAVNTKAYIQSSCPCNGSNTCVGEYNGHYCMTESGKKRYLKKPEKRHGFKLQQNPGHIYNKPGKFGPSSEMKELLLKAK